MHVAAQVHFWPWSSIAAEETVNLVDSEAIFPFYGSPVISLSVEADIYLPARHERFHPLGPAFSPPWSRDRCRLFETPHGTVANTSRSGALSIHNKEGGNVVRRSIRLVPQGIQQRDIYDKEGNAQDSPLARMVMEWSSYFEEVLERARQGNEKNERLEWQSVLDHLKKLGIESAEPMRALIVDIAYEMHKKLPEIVRAARRALFRERRLLPASRAEETDIACLLWYIKQPGQSMAEKVGPRQRLLGVARQETYNLHENRILKDFLERCAAAGSRYRANAVTENPSYSRSKRVQSVQTLASLCKQLGAVPHFEDVSSPNSSTPPNYVLLNDIRYRRVWYWYKRLLRQEQEKDRLWDWQSRTWADIARLLVSSAIIWHLNDLQSKELRFSTLYQGALRVRGEQLLGCRSAAGSETGPLRIACIRNGLIGDQWVLEIVHPEQAEHHPITLHLGATGGHLYLVVRPLAHNKSPKVVILWAVHSTAATDIPPWGDIGLSAEKALQKHQIALNMSRIKNAPELHGLVLCSSLTAAKSEIEAELNNLHLVTAPTKPWQWMSAVEDIALVLDDVLEQMLT